MNDEFVYYIGCLFESACTVEYWFHCMFQHVLLGVAQHSVIQDVLHATRMDAQAAEMASTKRTRPAMVSVWMPICMCLWHY